VIFQVPFSATGGITDGKRVAAGGGVTKSGLSKYVSFITITPPVYVIIIYPSDTH
jgi:hypothetical protein